jgi:transaldolase
MLLQKHMLMACVQPNLLEELMVSTEAVPKKLDASQAQAANLEKKTYIDNEADFRFYFNEDPMAVHKLSEGISKFAADAVTLKETLKAKIEA